MIFQALIGRQRYLLTLVAIILSVVCSLPVFAGSPLTFSDRSMLMNMKTIIANNSSSVAEPQSISLFQRLNLTKEQQQQIEHIHRQYRQRISKKKNTIIKLQQQLSDMMVGTEPVELLRAKNQQLSLVRQEIGSLRFESMLATREILTPQQRQKFRELVNSNSTKD